MNKMINSKWEEICKCIKEFDNIYHQIAIYLNLSDSSFWILYDLYNSKSGRTQKELCDDWYVSKQTINSSIKYLLSNGYIVFKYDEDNKKNKRIHLTDKGYNLAKISIEKVIEIENKSFYNINIKEMDAVINFFKKQVSTLEEETKKFMKEGIEHE